jgi:protein Tex
MGLDPGIRTGVKVAVVEPPARCCPRTPSTRTSRAATGTAALHTLAKLCERHGVQPDRHWQRHGQPRNRQAGRRPDQAMPSWHPDSALTKVVVSEAGASVYSASEYASKELPDLST